MRPVWIIAGLLILYAVLAWSAVSRTSPTYDEPLHVAAALAQSQWDDFRIDPESPAGFKRWMSFGLGERSMYTGRLWQEVADEPEAQWGWSVLTLYSSGDGQGGSSVTAGRFMMLLAAIGLGVVIAAWAWQIGGPWAGVIATAMFALDPNFLGHGPTANNDVIAGLGLAGTAYAVWHVRRQANWMTVSLLAAAAAITVTVSFAGVMVGLLVPLLLVLPLPGGERAACRERRRTGGRVETSETNSRPNPRSIVRHLAQAVVITLIVGLTCWAMIWAVYRFRYNPSGDYTFQFNLPSRTTTTPILRTVDRHRLLPQAYTYGLAYTLDSSTRRDAYLLGRKSDQGWWYYFPFAMAVKTPVATTFALFAALGLLRWRYRKHALSIACLLIPAGIYTALAMRSNLNVGLRHMLPVYPLAFIAVGAILSRYRKVAIGLLPLLAVECAFAYPHYIAHFNVVAGGPRGGFRILSESNLDWGQDLPLLAKWQAKNPGTRLYLSYFGTADPASYGVDYTNIGAGYAFLPATMPVPGEPGVIAVSATHLQGMYVAPNLQWFYKALRGQKPMDVLGGTIYLYEWK